MGMDEHTIIPSGVFTRNMVRSAGLNDYDLRYNENIIRVGSDLDAARGELATPGLQAIALAETFPAAWVSHHSAAELHGIPFENPPAAPQCTVPAAALRIRRTGVTCHIDRFEGRGVIELGGIPCSSPARIWVEIAPADRLQAISLGDQLIRKPRPRFEGRAHPFCELSDLRDFTHGVADRMARVKPRCLARDEWRHLTERLEHLRDWADLVRIGADSPPETEMRIAMIDAGLPEPILQHPIFDGDRLVTVADAAFPEDRVAIFYDGSPHRTPGALERDARRNNALAALHWTSFQSVLSDYRQGFTRTIALVAAELRRAA